MEKILLRFNDAEGEDIIIYTDSIYKYEFIDDNTTKVFCDTPTSVGDFPTIYVVPMNAVELVENVHGKDAKELIFKVEPPKPGSKEKIYVDLDA